VLAASIGVAGAVGGAVGVGIVATLTLRAMAEWRTNQLQQAARERHPIPPSP
jgi:F0F1-type ATP synthase membrane subunit c/vacuolar-type H+-ATPase subunit K